jgi:dienelactone hydrolase
MHEKISFFLAAGCAILHCATNKSSTGKLQTITRYDRSRTAVAEQNDKTKGRIIQLNIWYPSDAKSRRTNFSDYVELIGKELDDSPANKEYKQKGIDKYFEWPASAGANKKQFTDFLDKRIPMLAHKNAKWIKQKFPLVMLVHGFAADYAYLAEYIASQGFVVLHVPVKGTTKYELDYEGLGLQTQVTDYEFAISVLQKEFSFVAESAAAVGFSFGGQSAVALALRNPSVKAVVSLDGGIGSFFGAQLLSNQSYYLEKNIKAPILHLYNPTDPYTDLAWFRSIPYSERFLAAMKNMQHGHFTSFGLLNKIVPGIMGKDVVDPGNGYETVMLLTKEFIHQSLHDNLSTASGFFDQQKKNHTWIKGCLASIEIKAPGAS